MRIVLFPCVRSLFWFVEHATFFFSSSFFFSFFPRCRPVLDRMEVVVHELPGYRTLT